MYRMRPDGLAPIREFLEQFWDERLEALKREAELEERKKDGSEH
jgi:hypothetical protein